MSPEEAFEELEKSLKDRLDEFPRGRHIPLQAIQDAIYGVLEDFMNDYMPACPVRLPCGHVYQADNLIVSHKQNRDIIEIEYVCPRCAERYATEEEKTWDDLQVALDTEIADLKGKKVSGVVFESAKLHLQTALYQFKKDHPGARVLLPVCGHVQSLDSLQLDYFCRGGTISAEPVCRECVRGGVDEMRLAITLDLVNKVSYLSLNETEEVPLDSLTLYARAGKKLYRAQLDSELVKEDRLGVFIKLELEDEEERAKEPFKASDLREDEK